jgi:hypothetical protein
MALSVPLSRPTLRVGGGSAFFVSLLAMTLLKAILLIAAVGALGGIAKCCTGGEFAMPHRDGKKKVWRPGWIASIAVSSFAAVVVWCMYGPLAGFDVASSADVHAVLPLSQIGSSFLLGFSGARVLTLIAEKQAEKVAKNELAKILEEALPHIKR